MAHRQDIIPNQLQLPLVVRKIVSALKVHMPCQCVHTVLWQDKACLLAGHFTRALLKHVQCHMTKHKKGFVTS